MIFKEQKHKNLNRKYYHGKIKDFQEDKKVYEEFYLTTKKEYAFPYACRGGVVEEYQLKEVADIFNMNCLTDERKFFVYCRQNFPYAISDIPVLKSNDWCKIGGTEYRQSLINIIKELGYDGYFNFEIDKEIIDSYHKNGLYRYSNIHINSPAIAVFNKDILIKKDEYPIESLVDKDYERCFVKNNALESLSKSKDYSLEKFLNKMLNLTYAIDEEEIIEIFEKITDEDINKHLKVIKETIEFYSNRV